MATSRKKKSDAYSVLIVGCGHIAGGWDAIGDDSMVRTHAKAYLNHGGFRLAGCVDPDAERRLAFQALWGVERSFADISEAEDLAFDVASVCSPPEVHAPQLERLLEMSIGVVFCEKPLTANLTSSKRLVEAFEAEGRPLAVNYGRRWDPSMAELKREIAVGGWGRLLTAQGLYTKGIFANGSHMVDLLHFLLGPLEPVAVLRVVEDYLPTDPTLDAVLRTQDGAIIHMAACDRRAFTVFELDLVFEKGRVTLGDAGFRIMKRRIVDDARFDGYRVLESGLWQMTGFEAALPAAVANIHDCLAEDAIFPSTGRTALDAQHVCAELVRLSGRHG